MKYLKQINFDDAIKYLRDGEQVYAVDLSTRNKPTTKLFKNITIGDALTTEYIYQIIEEVEA